MCLTRVTKPTLFVKPIQQLRLANSGENSFMSYKQKSLKAMYKTVELQMVRKSEWMNLSLVNTNVIARTEETGAASSSMI